MRFRAALDASLWDEPVTGIGLSTRELWHALQARDDVTTERWGARLSGEHPRQARSRTRWALAELPLTLERETPPVFHAFGNFNLPLQPPKSVACALTVHDLIPLTSPGAVSTPFRWQFKLWLGRSLSLAKVVVCPSEATKRALVARYAVDPARVHVVPHGSEHVLRAAEVDDTSKAWLDSLLLPETFVLYAGALEARKNVGLVVDACLSLHRGGRPVTLVLAGQKWFGAGEAEAKLQAARDAGLDVRGLGYLRDEVLYALMARAGAFVFPSRDEGFGLPPLEAMRLGVPTVVGDVPALREVVGDAALVTGCDDVAGLAATLERLLGSSRERAAWGAKAKARAETFTWARSAQGHVAAWRRALEG